MRWAPMSARRPERLETVEVAPGMFVIVNAYSGPFDYFRPGGESAPELQPPATRKGKP